MTMKNFIQDDNNREEYHMEMNQTNVVVLPTILNDEHPEENIEAEKQFINGIQDNATFNHNNERLS